MVIKTINKKIYKNIGNGKWLKIFKNGRRVIYREKNCIVCKETYVASNKKSNYCSCSCSSSHHQLGEKSHRWTGGRIGNGRGYIYILKRDHPYACKPNFYVLEHRLIMEKKLGRYLRPGEIVHHINGIKNDNRLENLVLTTKSDHTKHHSFERWNDPLWKVSQILRRKKRRSEKI